MNKVQMRYFEEEDTLHIVIAEGSEAGSVELNPNITAELDEKGQLIGIEILRASTYLRDTLLDSVQAKVLHLAGTSAE